MDFAASAAIAAGGAIIADSGIVDVMKDYIFSIAKEEFKSVWYLKDEINGISDLVETIKCVEEDAEKKQLQNKDVRKWVRDRKNAGYDMEDVLDDYRVMVSTEDGQGVVTRWMGLAKDGLYLVCGIPLSCCPDIIPAPFTHRIEIAHRVRSIRKNLDGINQRKVKLSLVQHSVGGSNESERETSSLEDKEWPMIGRNELKTEIKKALLNSSTASTSKLSIVCIVGVGGMGKTTLAQNIYNDEDVKDVFYFKEWLYVGDKFDCQGLLNKVIGNSGQPRDLNVLHSNVAEKMKKESFLIVLDDAWLTNREEWGRFLRPLSQGNKGGAIIVTSRNSAVANAIPHRQKKLYELEKMSDAECIAIFERCAFMGQEAETYPHLKRLSEQVVRKLKGVPLAASIVGGFLHKHLEDEHKWRSIADDRWLHADEENVVDRVVGLSYLHLPSHLKPCFAHCAMFPKGFDFHKETTVRRWIAEGYVERPRGDMLMEHVGGGYFNELCQRCFLQLGPREYYGDSYIMHDLIHDFALKVFTEGLHVGASDAEDGASPEEIRHLSVSCNGTEPQELKILDNFKKLRTLILSSYVTIAPPMDVLAKFRYLRLLSLNVYALSEFPDSIRHLQFLRYLYIWFTGIRELPELVCDDLVKLQFLYLPYGCALPEGMNKLVNLRFIKVRDAGVPQFKGIGQLTSLQQLDTFKVKNKSGWKISELGGLNYLHGELVVCDLRNVTCKEEAEQACLKRKVHLENLVLDWKVEEEEAVLSSVQQEHVVEGEVLEGLFPPPHLKVLGIKENRGARFPSWMEEHRCPISSSLVTLELDGCCNWECLPTLGRFPSLKELRISQASSVKKIGPEFYGGTGESGGGYFPRLEILKLREMSAWKEWEMPTAGEIINSGGGGGRHVFPSLKELCIGECPRLLTLSPVLRHLPNLKELTVCMCPKLASFSAMLRHLTALEDLAIGGCDQLVLDGGVAEDDAEDEEIIFSSEQPVVVDSQVEEENVINDVVKIREVVEGQSPSPYLNKSLTLKNKRGAQLPRWTKNKHHRLLPSSLVRLQLYGCCNSWECLPSTLGQLPSLTELTIFMADHVKKIGPEFYGGTDAGVYFPRLESFSLIKMSAWEEWEMPAGEMEGGGRRHLFPSLKELSIEECPKLPSLSPVLSHLTSLERIRIIRCAELASSDGCGWMLPSLKRLSIEECPKLAPLSPILRHSSNLERIKIKKYAELASLEEEGDDGCGWMLPSLKRLSIEECPKLAFLSPILRHSSNLERIKIKKCDELASLEEEGDDGCRWMLPSLEDFSIEECPKLASLSPILRHSSNVKTIEIKKCDELALSSEEGDGECGWAFSGWLLNLIIQDCSAKLLLNLSQMLPHLTALDYLHIRGCRNLQCLPPGIHNLRSLRCLTIVDCPAIECLPDGGLPPSLELLWISGCPLLEGRCREGGPDRPKISTTTRVHLRPHLPDRY